MKALERIDSNMWLPMALIVPFTLLVAFFILQGHFAIAAVLCAFCVLVFVARHIEVMFLIWMLLSPILMSDNFAIMVVNDHPIITFDRIFILMLTGIIAVQLFLKSRTFLPTNNLEKLFLLLLLVLVISIMLKSDDKFRAGRIFLDSFFYPVAIYFLAKHFLQEERYFNSFIKVLFIISIYFACMGIYEALTGIDLFPTNLGIQEYSDWLRVNGPYINSVSFAVNLSMCFFIVLCTLETQISKRNPNFILILICGGVLLLVGTAVAVTYLRAAWASVILASGIWMILRRMGYFKMFIAGVLILSALYVSADRLASTQVYKGRVTNFETIESRFRIYDHALDLYQIEPILGIGFQNYSLRTEGTGIASSTHNNFIAFLTETGIPGILIVGAIIMLIFTKAFRYSAMSSRSPDLYFSRAFVAIAICFFIPWLTVESGYLPEINKMFFAILGAMIGRSLMVEQGKEYQQDFRKEDLLA